MEFFFFTKGGIHIEVKKESFVIYSLLLGAILVPVNSTMIAVALSSISTYYDQSLANITWVVTIYLIVMAVTQPIAGKLGDIYGHRRMYLIGVMLFLIGSIGCALAPNLAFLITFRSIQAAGGAILTPNSIALIRATVSPKNCLKQWGILDLEPVLVPHLDLLLVRFLFRVLIGTLYSLSISHSCSLHLLPAYYSFRKQSIPAYKQM